MVIVVIIQGHHSCSFIIQEHLLGSSIIQEHLSFFKSFFSLQVFNIIPWYSIQMMITRLIEQMKSWEHSLHGPCTWLREVRKSYKSPFRLVL